MHTQSNGLRERERESVQIEKQLVKDKKPPLVSALQLAADLATS